MTLACRGKVKITFSPVLWLGRGGQAFLGALSPCLLVVPGWRFLWNSVWNIREAKEAEGTHHHAFRQV